VRITDRYIFDGGDLRSPSIMTIIAIAIIENVQSLIFIYTGITTPLYIFLIQTDSILVCSLLFRSRLVGYPTGKIQKFTKSIIYNIYSLLLYLFLFLLLFNFDPNTEVIISRLPTSKFEEIMVPFNAMMDTDFYHGHVNFFYLVFAFCVPALIVWFDVVEKGWNTKKVKLDFLLFVPFLVILLNVINFSNYYILFALNFIYLMIPFVFIVKESRSIIRHSNTIDVRISEILKVMKKLVAACQNCSIPEDQCKMSNIQKCQVKMIAQMMFKDKALQEHCLQRHIIKRQLWDNIIFRIKEEINELSSQDLIAILK
jgi:hypothetical protein